jgi:uncharacterized membrane protein (DUF485 family)
MPTFGEIVDAANKLGVVEALLIFVLFVQAILLIGLFRMLKRKDEAQDLINRMLIEHLTGVSGAGGPDRGRNGE